jgi:hypothetical protein
MLLVFNNNKEISPLTTATIIILSLSFLPLNDGHNSGLLLFSAKPVFAQLSRRAIPYAEQQVSTIPSSSFISSMANFELFMDSFANSIFNGTSTFAGVGTTIVNGVEVSGISLDKSQNQLSVILSHTSTQAGTGNNITSTETNITTTSATPNSNSVSIIAMRIPISPSDILSIGAAASSSSSSSSSDALGGSIADNTAENQSNAFPSDGFNPFSLLSSLQIGSTTLIDVDWSEPQTVTMDLVGSAGTNQEQQQLNSDNELAAIDFVLVSVIPYTGLGNDTASSNT